MAQTVERKYGFWNWGTGLAIAIAMGCLGIIFLVYKSTTYEFQMVDDNYYEREVEFNDKVTAIQLARTLSDTLHFEETDDFLIVKFPKEMAQSKVQGVLSFYCPINAAKDFIKPLVFNHENLVAVPKDGMLATQYQVAAQFTMNDKAYHIEQVYQIKK